MYLSNTFRRVFVVSGLLAAAAVIPLKTTNPATAAPITWGSIFDITSLSDLNTNGAFIDALNLGNGANSLVTIGDIVFTPSQATFPNGTGDGGYFTGDGGDTGDATLNLLLDSHAYAVGGAGTSTTVTLEGLTAGQEYELQLIAAADRRGCCTARNLAASDGVNISGDMMRGGPGSVIGSFTADAATQDFMVIGGTVDPVDPGLSAYILRSTAGGSVSAAIDRMTGNLTLTNNTIAPLDILGYTVRSSYGALYQTNWNTITGNSDVDGDGSIDANDPWTILTDPASHADLAEAELAGGDGGEIAVGRTVDFGNVWLQSPTEDVRLQLLRTDGTIQTVGVGFTGNGGERLQVGDLDFNNVMDVNDWAIFLTGLSGDLSDLSAAEAYQRGDLVGDDLEVNHADFKAFKQAYEEANGAGSFGAMVAGVPEPASVGIVLIGMLALSLGAFRRRAWRQTIRAAGVLVAAAALLTTNVGQAETILGTGAASLVGMDLTDQDDIHDEVADPPTGFDATFFANSEPGFGGGEFAFNVFDNDVGGGNDKWCCGAGDPEPFPMIVGATFAQGYSLTSFTLSSGNDTPDRDPAVWSIEGSTDTTTGLDGTWTPIYSRTGSGSSDWTDRNQVIQYSPADGDPFLTTERFTSFRMTTTETAGGGTTGAYFQINEIELFGTPALLTLEVNTDTGATAIKHADTEDFDFEMNFYTISSDSGSLDPSGWNSLDAQNVDAVDGTGDPDNIAGNSLLEGWDEAASENLTPNVLTEAFLLGHSTLGIGQRLGIGNAFDGGKGVEDLVFQYGLTSGTYHTGLVEYVTGGFLEADFDTDGDVDGDDFLAWQSGFGTPSGAQKENGDYDNDGDVDGDDFLGWQAEFGSSEGNGANAVPEPSALGLLGLILAGLAVGLSRRNPGGRFMNAAKHLLPAVAVALTVMQATAFASVTNDRDYRLGDDDGVSAGSSVNGSTDSAAPANNLIKFSGNPTYVSVGPTGAARPGALAGELGIQFDGVDDYLEGDRLGLPSTSAAADFVDYTGIANRGFQLWVNPSVGASAEEQHIVMDTLQHGVGITTGGNWFMQYAGTAHDTGVAVASGEWHHVMVVRPYGAANGSRMYLNGVAIGAAGGGYTGADENFLSLSAATGDNDPTFPGASNFFTGILDDLEMFVMGTSTDTMTDYGTFNAAEDNPIIADAVAGLPDGDVDMNGVLDPVADVDAFVAGWLSENVINGVAVGDLVTRGNGDLNIDGSTDLADAFILHEALVVGGFGGLPGFGFGVPEPTTAALALIGLLGLAIARRRPIG